jgi:hypothetical protein
LYSELRFELCIKVVGNKKFAENKLNLVGYHVQTNGLERVTDKAADKGRYETL